MNKRSLLVKLIFLCVIFLILAWASIRFIGHEYGFMRGYDFSMGNMELKLTESYKSAEIDTINAKTISEKIEVIKCDGEDITVEYYSSSDDQKMYPRISAEGKTLNIVTENKRFFLHYLGGRLIVKVPDAKNLKLESTSGNIVNEVEALGNSEISTVSGSITVNTGGEKISAKSVSGEIKIAEAFEGLSAKTTSGEIEVCAGEKTKGYVNLESISGGIKVLIMEPEIDGYSVDYSTVSGSIRDEYTGENYSGKGSFDEGNKKIKIFAKTISGSIRLAY